MAQTDVVTYDCIALAKSVNIFLSRHTIEWLYRAHNFNKRSADIRKMIFLDLRYYGSEIEGVPSEGQEFTATASVMNPLPVSLKRCRFVIEGPSLETPIKIKLEHEVEPNSEAKVKFNARPKFPGRTTIAAKFYSNELGDVDGFIVFKVGDKAPGDTNGLSNNISS